VRLTVLLAVLILGALWLGIFALGFGLNLCFIAVRKVFGVGPGADAVSPWTLLAIGTLLTGALLYGGLLFVGGLMTWAAVENYRRTGSLSDAGLIGFCLIALILAIAVTAPVLRKWVPIIFEGIRLYREELQKQRRQEPS
jgi:hypothetical protein